MSAWSRFPSSVPSWCFLSELLTLSDKWPNLCPSYLREGRLCFGVRDMKQSSYVVVSWVWIFTGSPHGDGLHQRVSLPGSTYSQLLANAPTTLRYGCSLTGSDIRTCLLWQSVLGKHGCADDQDVRRYTDVCRIKGKPGDDPSHPVPYLVPINWGLTALG